MRSLIRIPMHFFFAFPGNTSDTARHSISGIMHGQNQNTPTGRGHGAKRSQRHELSKS